MSLFLKSCNQTQVKMDSIKAQGCLEIIAEGFGFLRTNNYLPSLEDIYVSSTENFNYKLAI